MYRVQNNIKLSNKELNFNLNQFISIDLVSSLTNSLSKKISRLGLNITNIKTQVDLALKNKDNVSTFNILKGGCLNEIYSFESKLLQINNNINNINKIITIFSNIIRVLSIFPLTSSISNIINNAKKIIDGLTLLIKILIPLINNLLSELDYEKKRLNINEDSKLIEQNNIKLGIVEGVEYKGFKFFIKEDNNPKYIVDEVYRRRYAVAIDSKGKEIIQSDYSYTLDPNVLIEQIKLEIDRQNLKS